MFDSVEQGLSEIFTAVMDESAEIREIERDTSQQIYALQHQVTSLCAAMREIVAMLRKEKRGSKVHDPERAVPEA